MAEWSMNDWENAFGYAPESGGNKLNDDDIKGINEVKISSRLNRTEEEIEKFSIDESLKPVERALKILRYCAIPLTDIKYDNKRMQRAGIELQKQCVVMDLIKGTFITEEESKQVLSALLEAVQRERPTFQIHTARQLAEWMEKEVRPPLADSMLKPIRTMMTSRDQDVFDAWADLLLISIRWMSMEILLGEILPEAILNGGISQPAPVRLWSCRVLGALAQRMDGSTIENTFFRKAMALCQDIDDEVRTCMCEQLNYIAKSVGPELTKTVILDEYTELLEDEEKSVRSAALCQYIHLLAEEVNSSASTKQSSTQQQTQTTQSSQQLQQQQQKIIPLQAIAARPIINASTQIEIVIPQIKKICLEKPENLLETICYEFGRFLWYTRESLTEEETNWFVNWFIKMSETKDNTIRSACAYNCPAILKYISYLLIDDVKSEDRRRKLMSNGGPSVIQSPLFPAVHSMIEHLAKDEDVQIRRRVASGLHELCSITGKDSYKTYREMWLRLLSDESEAVACAIYETVPDVMRSFSKYQNWTRQDSDYNELFTAILKRHTFYLASASDNSKMSYNWRNHKLLLDQFPIFVEVFDHDLVHQHAVPVLFNILTNKESCANFTIQKQVVRILCIYARKLNLLEYRDKIWRMARESFTPVHSTQYRMRLVFLEICVNVLEMFSCKFFKEMFMSEFLEMGTDPVANVRLKMIKMLPAARATLKLPADNYLLTKINDIVNAMVGNEKEKSVTVALKEIIDGAMFEDQVLLSLMRPTTKGGASLSATAPSNLSSSGTSAVGVRPQTDKEKEEEEAKLIAEEVEMEEIRKKKDSEAARAEFSRKSTAVGGGGGSGGGNSQIDKLSKDRRMLNSAASSLQSKEGNLGKKLGPSTAARRNTLGTNGLGNGVGPSIALQSQLREMSIGVGGGKNGGGQDSNSKRLSTGNLTSLPSPGSPNSSSAAPSSKSKPSTSASGTGVGSTGQSLLSSQSQSSTSSVSRTSPSGNTTSSSSAGGISGANQSSRPSSTSAQSASRRHTVSSLSSSSSSASGLAGRKKSSDDDINDSPSSSAGGVNSSSSPVSKLGHHSTSSATTAPFRSSPLGAGAAGSFIPTATQMTLGGTAGYTNLMHHHNTTPATSKLPSGLSWLNSGSGVGPGSSAGTGGGVSPSINWPSSISSTSSSNSSSSATMSSSGASARGIGGGNGRK